MKEERSRSRKKEKKSWDVWRRPVIAASATPVYCGMVSEGAITELGRL